MKVALVGPIATAYGPKTKPFSLVRIANEDVLSIETAPTGIVLNATLRDENGQLVATITKNVYKPYAPNDYEITSDNHSVLILNSKDQVVLYFRYLNPKAIKVLGIFRVPKRPPVVVEEGRILVGSSELRLGYWHV